MPRAPTKERQAVLRRWLDANRDRYDRELALTVAATNELSATGEELDWLALAWRMERGDDVAATEDVAPVGGVEGQRPANTAGGGGDAGGEAPASGGAKPATAVRSTSGQVVGLTAGATQNLPAVREHTPLDNFARLGSWLALAESGSDSEKARGAAAALRLYYAQELGLSVLAATELSVIKGRLVVGAKLLRARALDAGYRVVRKDSTDETCTAVLIDRRTGEVIGETTYTIEEARKAGLIRDKSPWQTYPARMLWHRATKYVVDDYAPHVSLGLILEGESPDDRRTPPPPAPAEDDGDTIDGDPVEVTDEDVQQGTQEAEDADWWPAKDSPPEAPAE